MIRRTKRAPFLPVSTKMLGSCVYASMLFLVCYVHSPAFAGAYLSADILLAGDQYSDLSLIAEQPMRYDGPGWVISSGLAWTAWSKDQDWIEYTLHLSAGNWNIGLNAINHSEDSAGLGENALWYPQFEIKMEIVDLLRGRLVVPASDTIENNGFLNVDLLEGDYTIRFTWLNDKYEPLQSLDANLQINSVFFDRVGVYGASVEDLNENGLPDDQEVEGFIDLNNDGVNDLLQATMKCVQSSTGIEPICLQPKSADLSIIRLKFVDDELVWIPLQSLGNMPFGLLSFALSKGSNDVDATVDAFFSEAIPNGAQFFRYNPYNGSLEKENEIIFSSDRKSISFSIEQALLESESGENDDTVFVYAGLEEPEPSEGSASDNGTNADAGGSGVGCFIDILNEW
jgi:hypothetical protein